MAKKSRVHKSTLNTQSVQSPDTSHATFANTSQFRVGVTLLVELMDQDKLSTIKLAEKVGVSKGVIGKMLRNETVDVASAEKIAQNFHLSLNEIGEHLAVPLGSPVLYQAFGLSDQTRQIDETSSGYQNFEYGDDPTRPEELPTKNNPIGYLWADASGTSSVKAHVARDNLSNWSYLRIEFDTPVKGLDGAPYPSNVAIHPQWLTAVNVDLNKFPWLTIPCRVKLESNETSPAVQLSLRVRDRKLRQWVFGTMDSNHITSVASCPKLEGEWVLISAQLTANKWTAFDAAAATGIERRDFSVITSIICEVGRGGTGKRPGTGAGVIDIGPITFENSPLNRK